MVQIKAGEQTQLRIRDRLQIYLSLQEHAELCVNITDINPAGTMQNITYRYGIYYQFDLNISTQLQARFQMHINQSQ